MNTKKDFTATVADQRQIAPDSYEMQIAARGLTFAPGQFFMITAPGRELRRAFAPMTQSVDGFSFVYTRVGAGTAALSECNTGAAVQILAPLGNGYDLSAITSAAPTNTAILIGGGSGAPSLALLGNELRRRGITVRTFVGARSAPQILAPEIMRANSDELTLAADDGSAWFHGNAVAAARESFRPGVGAATVFACGPRPMLRAAAQWAAENHLSCQVSLEERMGCGFGVCMGCAVAIQVNGQKVYRRVCYDGPVFDGQAIAWEE